MSFDTIDNADLVKGIDKALLKTQFPIQAPLSYRLGGVI